MEARRIRDFDFSIIGSDQEKRLRERATDQEADQLDEANRNALYYEARLGRYNSRETIWDALKRVSIPVIAMIALMSFMNGNFLEVKLLSRDVQIITTLCCGSGWLNTLIGNYFPSVLNVLFFGAILLLGVVSLFFISKAAYYDRKKANLRSAAQYWLVKGNVIRDRLEKRKPEKSGDITVNVGGDMTNAQVGGSSDTNITIRINEGEALRQIEQILSNENVQGSNIAPDVKDVAKRILAIFLADGITK